MSLRPDINQIREHILRKYVGKEFTMGDIYYDFNMKFSKSIFGTLRNAIVNLTKDGTLTYRITTRGTPHLESKETTKGAIFKIKKNP